MADYTLAVGTRDPRPFAAADDAEAVRSAVAIIHDRFGADLAEKPFEVATLLGPAGLVTRPAERLDEFVRRLEVDDQGRVEPGDTANPDCNGE